MADFVGIFWANVCTDLTNILRKKYSNFAYSTTTATETLTTLNFQVQHNRFELKKYYNVLLTESWRILYWGILEAWDHSSTDYSRRNGLWWFPQKWSVWQNPDQERTNQNVLIYRYLKITLLYIVNLFE